MIELWVKAIHVIAIVAWMAGLLYLPRLMVYHSVQAVGSGTSDVFKVMERRLLKAIMRPSAVIAIITGLALIHYGGFNHRDIWLLVKLFAVVVLFATHGMLEGFVAKFARDERPKSRTYFRVLNEVPTVALVIIVIMVIIKPFS